MAHDERYRNNGHSSPVHTGYDPGTLAEIRNLLNWQDELQTSQSTVRIIVHPSVLRPFNHETQTHFDHADHPELPTSWSPTSIGQGMENGSVLSVRQHQPSPLKRRWNREDPLPISNTHRQCVDETGLPPPPRSVRPQKRGRPQCRLEDLGVDISGDDGGRLSDNEDDNEDDKRGRWTEEEVKKFVYALMGPDGYWERFIKNPTNVCKKVSVVIRDRC